MDAIRIEGLTKKYKDVVAVDNLNLSVKQGEIFSLLGVNGAGKTTTIKMLSCITRPTCGDAFLMGKSLSTEASTVKSLIACRPKKLLWHQDLRCRKILPSWRVSTAVELERALLAGQASQIFPHIWWVLAYGLAIFVVAILLFLKQMKGR